MIAIFWMVLSTLSSVSTTTVHSPACSSDGLLLPTALPRDPSLWSPSTNLNITILGLDDAQKAALILAFDQSLVLGAAFNHDHGYKTLNKAFTSAASSSSTFKCCMCLWALAYLSSPNINRDCASDRLVAAKDAVQQASHGCMVMESLLEQELIYSMVARFPENRTNYNGARFDQEFASRMGEIATTSMKPTLVTADLHTFFAESIMNTIAWNYYKQEDGSLRDEAKVAKNSLDLALSVAPKHPLALHLSIHLMEPSSDPSLIAMAVTAGDTLRSVIPPDLAAGIGHLLHMPGHAFTRAAGGRYHDAVLANIAGAKDDSNYISDCGISPDDFYRQLYYTHKHAFLVWAAIMSGESEVALNATAKLFSDCNLVKVASNMGGVFFTYPPFKLQILLKFGKFTELVNEPRPESTGDELLDMYIGAIYFFARSYAQASLGNCFQSYEDRIQFLSLASNKTLRNVRVFMIHISDILDLSEHIMDGRLCRLCSEYMPECSELDHLTTAVDIQDTFPYMEPRYWPDNVRSCLGAALLRQNRADQALAVFEKDLTTPQNPNNGWSLKGKELALRALGRDEEAEEVAQSFFEAWQFADVDLYEPCF